MVILCHIKGGIMIIKYEESYKYLKENNYGISSITNPKDHTIVYISKKIEKNQ